MNVLVDSYVPQWLKAVNQHTKVYYLGHPLVDIEGQHHRYISSFGGSDTWQSADTDARSEIQDGSQTSFQRHIDKLIQLMEKEEACRIQLTQSWNRYAIRIFPYEGRYRSEQRGPLLVSARSPEVKEFSPPVFINDVCIYKVVKICDDQVACRTKAINTGTKVIRSRRLFCQSSWSEKSEEHRNIGCNCHKYSFWLVQYHICARPHKVFTA